jgi:pimeloyl-ACP methyl ester carboxylesterase
MAATEEVASPTKSRTDRTLRLPDGRTLGYAEYGDPSGRPVFFFHTGGMSRLLGRLTDQTASRLGIRIIAPDRPGIGLSDYQAGRTLLDWPKDVIRLAEHLNLDRFAVLGHSAGTPHVCACASAIPDRLTAAAIVGCVGPPEAPTAGMFVPFALLRRFPRLYGWSFAMMGRGARKDPDRAVEKFAKAPFLAEVDRTVAARPENHKVLAEATFEAHRPGSRGLAWDAALLVRPWGFRMQDITMPIRLWHGEADGMAPIAQARYVAGLLPNCVAMFYPDEGHLSVLVNHLEDILAATGG